MDRMDFHNPVFVGDLVTFKASLNMAGKTSMEVGVRVEREQPLSGETKHVASAYLTMVAMGEDRKPQPIPPLTVITDEEVRRNRQAIARREVRLKERQAK
jgi:acyl-CoA hydrolase